MAGNFFSNRLSILNDKTPLQRNLLLPVILSCLLEVSTKHR